MSEMRYFPMLVYVWDISNLFSLEEGERIWLRALSLLDENRQLKLVKYRNHKDKVRSIAAGLLLRYGWLQYNRWKTDGGTLQKAGQASSISFEALLQELEAVPCILTCREGVHEKPYLANNPDICFNLSHSGSYAALVIGDRQCGIDVQEKRMLSNSFCRRYYQEDEKKWLQQHPGCEIQIFSLKEAVTKYSGMGISRGIDRFSVVSLLEGERIWEMQSLLWGESYCMEDGSVLSVVSSGDRDPLYHRSKLTLSPCNNV